MGKFSIILVRKSSINPQLVSIVDNQDRKLGYISTGYSS